MSAHEVLTMGRIGVDLYPEQIGVPLGEVRTFAKSLGGSASNVAVAAARYGRRAAVITRVGADPFGEYLRTALRGFGVDDRFVGTVPHLPTPVTFCEIFPPDHFPLYFYRYPKAPDLEIHPSELDLDAIRRAEIFWITGTGLSAEPSRTATLTALKERNRSGITVFDLDWRPMFWDSPAEARHWYTEALRHTTVAVGNLAEVEVAVGRANPERALLQHGVDLAVIKRGPAGVLAACKDQKVEAPPEKIKTLNGLGAGDAFGGALCHGLLAGWDLPATIRFANAAGALVATRLACADAMPSEAEVRDLLAGAGHG
ncbi:5-dehydro-2-deoxygluconokinase [Actinoplanes awajinensis]|uniref:5-dehydro-2-deoxygluconokinase n=1 Tax=Actinoplanes awajinensis subsp. mycoplanecinus TaxID=135947 RepID=A0A117MNP6_9ACTN|nr:5-dehydro-2-deoxygluconokinase [Actinoplanes awajinensis]KUL27382.1 5-dehydro-2-deoxygluconokinase [Actinoplanes awajinensis subsp. mycoplanecinus]